MALTGDDLVKKAILDIAEKTKGIMGVSDIFRRVDSTLIESSIKELSRPGLIYKTNYALINALNFDDEGKAALEKAGLSHYLDPMNTTLRYITMRRVVLILFLAL